MQKCIIFVKKDKKYRKVRGHCHYTGEYRGAVHSISNLKYIVPKYRVSFCHKTVSNLKNNLFVY